MSFPEMLQKQIVKGSFHRGVLLPIFIVMSNLSEIFPDRLAKTEFIIIFWFYLNDLKVYAMRFNTFVQLLTANEENCWLITRDMLVAAKF